MFIPKSPKATTRLTVVLLKNHRSVLNPKTLWTYGNKKNVIGKGFKHRKSKEILICSIADGYCLPHIFCLSMHDDRKVESITLLFQIERVCRQQVKLDINSGEFSKMGRKHCEKLRNCSS